MSSNDTGSQASEGASLNTAYVVVESPKGIRINEETNHSNRNTTPSTQASNRTSSSANIINPPLFKLKILDALKNNNCDQLRQLVISVKDSVNYYELSLVKNLIFNLAVQVAPLQVITQLLSDDSKDLGIDVNYQDENGNAPLHLAALNSRADVVQLLLRDERINDTILNNDLKQPIEVAKDLRIVELLQKERATYVERIANDLRSAFTNHDFARLDEILASPRNFELLDINGNDPETGDTVLHEFVKKNDIGMVKWILTHGGDPFKRDRKGKLPIELVGKNNDTMKKILKDATKDQNVISQAGRSTGFKAPTYKGYLRKWTNFASGYKLRWFILDSNGILSYYKSQEDTNNACRGSLNMKSAILHLDSSEKQKFEIISKSGVRWHLKSNYPIETNRWVWSLQGAIRYAKDKERAIRYSQETERKDSFDSVGGAGVNRHTRNLSSGSFEESSNKVESSANSLADIKENERLKQTEARRPSQIVYDTDDEDDNESREVSIVQENEDIDIESGPYIQEISVLKRGFSLELGSLRELLFSVKETMNTSSEPLNISLGAIETLTESFDRLNTLVSKRDEKLIRDLQKQKDINELWINSIRDLENELLAKNSELQNFEAERRNLKKVLTKKFGNIGSPLADVPATPEAQPTGPSPLGAAESNTVQEEPFDANDVEISRFINEDEDSDDEFFDAADFEEDDEVSERATQESIAGGVAGSTAATTPAPSVQEPETTEKPVGIEQKQEEEEEQVEAEYSNELQQKKDLLMKNEGTFKGYDFKPRSELALKVDDRPKIGLWGILKSMIGKDMTKIALPVTFNEPTSLLQRVAEDLEYVNLLDQAASFEDSTLRLLYVAAFAASEYGSTTNRVAKPFNPLLGETYEYARPDLGFRFFTEQVSHHPPVSAAIAEASKWDYYGETSVKSGFNGRSFDVQPLGIWYLHLRPDQSSHKEELYTWKKITSSVIGIIVGNPSVDNYGEMIITNNQTGDKAVLNFKPRGWRGASAYEMSGVIYNRKGEKVWSIGGHWNNRIFGKKVIKNDSSIDYSNKKISSTPTEDGTKFLIWQMAPRPKVPFNLTSYAITLNEPNPKLLEYVSPSDTRLRPDQRAMEDGKYDEAGVLKNRVEEKQRAARKKREQQGEKYHPTYFTRETHKATGEEYWKFNGEYWKQRKDGKLPNIDIF